MSKRRDAVIKAVRALEPNLGAMLEDAGIPGCTARVVFEDGDGMSLAMGQKSRGRADSPDGGTVFMIGSCSKAFTALTASALAYRGTVDLDAPISSHVPVRFEGAGERSPCATS
jgi:CubicO group peptidase (beta-lactamase class C family)